jgi:HTH-type transcriptional regulator / antitoxin HigA
MTRPKDKKDLEFKPNWCVPPGATIKELMEDRNISQYEIMNKLKLSNDDYNLLIIGDLLVNEEIAKGLADLTGTSVQFWENREKHYREGLARACKKTF